MNPWLNALMAFWASLAAEAFITVPLDYKNPIIKDAFCPSLTKTASKYSKYITREAIRREVRKMMMEEPPEGGFWIPENASLLSMFRTYYGEAASPLRFFKAINSIAWSNAEVDTTLSSKYDPRYHFDAENLQEGQDLLSSRHNYIVSSIIKDQAYPYARDLIGMSLHSIQDFYSHSTWIEQNNLGILEDLGIPGLIIPNVAGPTEETCTSCGKSTDGCLSNVLSYGRLSSGYIEFPSSNDIMNASKPQQIGKCSFGGSYDDSRNKYPTGGINKASASPCFSPHYSLHEKAAERAIEASESYLSTIRYTINNDHFRNLLDLYNGSALVVVMDTTGSMSGEINGVKEQVKEIVRSINPEVYILVPFTDPGFGPAEKVDDGEEFIGKLEALKADGGGDLPEMAWSGLQLALSITPEYSTLYLFTDAPGKDEHLFNSVLLLAQSKHITITVVYTASGPSDFYRQIAEGTGGALIEVGKESFDTSVPIINSGVEQSKATIDRRTFNDSSDHSFEFPVDETVTELKIIVEGTIHMANIADQTGRAHDLLSGSGPFSKVAYSDELSAYIFHLPQNGMWNLSIKGEGTFHITIEASSVLDVLVEITEFDPEPPRPGYLRLAGRPLEGKEYYVEVMLIGWLESNVDQLTRMSLLTMDGSEIGSINYDGEMRDEIFIKTERLADEPFVLAFTGTLKDGTRFRRIFPTIITPVTVEVELPSTSWNITGVAGSTVNITVLVTNRGEADDFKQKAVNSKGYDFDESTFDEAVINEDETKAVVVSFKIPEDEADWSVSEIVITSAAKSKEDNVNSQVSYLMVVPKDKDIIEPRCSTSNVPDCGSFNKESTCHLGNWTVEAIIRDEDSGLSHIYPQPSRKSIWLSTPPMPSGTTPAEVLMVSSCCNRKVDIIGVDEQGNIGKCQYDMGPMNGVYSFEAEERSSTWISLKWVVTNLRDDLLRYMLRIKSGLDDEFHKIICDELTCSYNVTKLSPCQQYTFILTPTYSNKSHTMSGSSSTVNTYTLNANPGAPLNVKFNQTGNEINVRWDSPKLDVCVEEYKVCFRKTKIEGEDGEPICYRLASPNFSLDTGEAQALALSSLSSIGKSGSEKYYHCGSKMCADDKKGAKPCLCFNGGNTNSISWIALIVLLPTTFSFYLN